MSGIGPDPLPFLHSIPKIAHGGQISVYGTEKTADIEGMEKRRPGLVNNSSMTRRQLLASGVLSMAGWVLAPIRTVAATVKDDLDLVARIPQMAGREGPLLVFRDFVADPDVEVEQHIRLQMAQQKDLLDLVRNKIGFEKQVRLSVEDIQVRQKFVPQLQENHAAAYQRYCLDITDYIFEMNQMDNFYADITSPTESYPSISETGISAFLVHRLAKDFQAVCRFTAESGRSVKYKATGAIFSNHLGAVDLEIQLLAPGQFRLSRKPFTIWQNDTQNLYTLLSVPVEETLHYHLGKATDREIAEALENHPPENLSAAQRLAEEWMAVEESVVGGLVNRVIAHYRDQHTFSIPDFVAGGNRPAVPSLHQYRYRDRGIQVVQKLGFQEAVALYMDSPSNFRDQLFREQKA